MQKRIQNFVFYFLPIIFFTFFWYVFLLDKQLSNINYPLFLWNQINLFNGDSYYIFSIVKAISHNDLTLFPYIINEKLNAPFTANWNDFPISYGLLVIPGIIAKFTNVFSAINLTLFLSQILSFYVFFIVSKKLHIQNFLAVILSIAFAFSPYFFFRGISHFSYAIYFYLPLFVLFFRYYLLGSLTRNRSIAFALLLFLISFLNIYFSFISILIFLWISIYSKKINKNYYFILLFFAWFIGFLFSIYNFFIFGFYEGFNNTIVHRTLIGAHVYSLNLSDLIFPFDHNNELIQYLSNTIYYSEKPSSLNNETNFSYLGIISLFGFVFLFIDILRNKNITYDQLLIRNSIILIFVFAVSGGFIYLLSSFGFNYVRATNRFSIIIIMLLLLYIGLKFNERNFNTINKFLIFILIIPLLIYDQVPSKIFNDSYKINFYNKIDEDIHAAKYLEKNLPKNSNVFMFPVQDYPENPSLFDMNDYENFRLYIHSENLNYSYGTHKGRNDNRWQKNIDLRYIEKSKKFLSNSQFDAFVINKKGISLEDKEILNIYKKNNYDWKEYSDFFVIKINKNNNNVNKFKFDSYIEFDSNFYSEEKDNEHSWRWSKSSNNKIFIKKSWLDNENKNFTFSFTLNKTSNCSVRVTVDDKTYDVILQNEQSKEITIKSFLNNSIKTINLISDCKPQRLNQTDPRYFTYNISNYKIY